MKKKSFLQTLVIGAALTACLAASLEANAQTVDQGDFSDGDVGQAPNTDSDFVPGLGMGMPTYGGAGCPQGSVNPILSPDQRSLSVLFDQYIARAGGPGGPARVQVGCQLNIPFNVPPGYAVQVVKLDYRGFTSVPNQARSTFAAGFRFLGANGSETGAPRVARAKVFIGPRQENFVVSSMMRGPGWSPCGQSFVLGAESMMNAATNRSNEEVTTTVDSLDAVQTPVVYSLRWKRCDAADPRPDHRPPPIGRPGRDGPWRPMPPPPPPRRGGGWGPRR